MSSTKDEKDKKLNDYVNEVKLKIREKSKNIEASVVANFWNNPKYFLDYSKLKDDNFNNPIWKFYFKIGKKMSEKGYSSLTEVDVELFLQNSKSLFDKYNEIGGYSKISVIMDVCDDKNLDVHVDEILKWSSCYSLVNKMSITNELIEKMDELSSDDVYNYYNIQLNNTFTSVTNNSLIGRLTDDLDKLIEDSDKGLDRGMPFINSTMLSNQLNGWQDGKILLVSGLSGAGKTTWIQDVVLCSLWELQEKAVIILNEQSKQDWQKKMLTWIINNIILKDTKMFFNSSRFGQGGFSEKEREWLNKAKEVLEEKQDSGDIVIVELLSYSRKEAERHIKQFAGLGYKKFIIDTFKVSADATDAMWESLMNDMRCLDDLVKSSNLNVGLICTLQLQKSSRMLRYLTVDNIGQSKSVVDVAHACILFRRVWVDEYKGGKHELKVYKKIEGTESTVEVELDPRKNYIVIFVIKNRSGESETYQYVCEQNLGTLVYNEVGICNIMPD